MAGRVNAGGDGLQSSRTARRPGPNIAPPKLYARTFSARFRAAGPLLLTSDLGT